MPKRNLYIVGTLFYVLLLCSASVVAYKSNQILTEPMKLITHKTYNQMVIHEMPDVTPVVISVSKQERKIVVTPKPTSTSSVPISTPVRPNVSTASFPSCYWHPGWFYGSHYNGSFEYGTDFDCTYRTPAIALWSGQVVYAQRLCWSSCYSSTVGGVVVVAAMVPGYGIEDTYYLHLDEIAKGITNGTYIHAGTLLGWTGGQTGYGYWPTSPQFTSGPHIEIGWCYPFLLCRVGRNANPLWAIEQARGS